MAEAVKKRGERLRSQVNNINLFYLIFILWNVVENLAITTFDNILGIKVSTINAINAFLILALLMLQIVFCQRYTLRQIVIILSITVPVVVSTLFSDINYILSAWMFIVASQNSDINKIVRIAYKILLCIMPIVLLSCVCGIIPDYTIYRGEVLRHSLGYIHPNVLGMKVFQAVIYHVFLHNGKENRFTNLIVVFIAIIFVYYVPNSQTPVVLLGGLLFLLSIYYLTKKYTLFMSIFGWVMIAAALIFNVGSVIFSIIGTDSHRILQILNRLMSTRLSQSHRVFLIYGSSLWGQKVYITEAERSSAGLSGFFYLDNTYMILLIKFGIVIYIIFSVVYLAMMIKLFKEKRYIMLIIYFVYSLYGIMEPSMYRFSYNTMLLLLGELLYKKNINDIGEKIGRKLRRYRIVYRKH